MKMSWMKLLATTWVSQPDYSGLESKLYVQLYKICYVKHKTLYIICSLKKMNARQNLYDGYCCHTIISPDIGLIFSSKSDNF